MALQKARILVVDDSVLIRKLLTEVLYDDPDLVIAGTASNGKIALSMIPQVNPDLITMDIEMPEMDGLQTLKEIRKIYPKLPVIMVSSHTEKGAAQTIDALTSGANDYIHKPSKMGSLDMAMEAMRSHLLPKIRALCGLKDRFQPTSVPLFPPRAVRPPIPIKSNSQAIHVVVIGISTGGPNALSEIMPLFPAQFPVPILIVQHMPASFTKLLAERLAARSTLKIKEAVNGEIISAGQVYIAPGDYHLTLVRDGVHYRVRTHQAPPENSCRPSVDVLFRSAVEVYGSSVLGVVMTGMGQDGLRGCEGIKDKGGVVFIQDEATSVVWGMPGFVSNAGLADKVLPLSQIAPEVVRRVGAVK